MNGIYLNKYQSVGLARPQHTAIGRVRGRQVLETEGTFKLREQQVAYHYNVRNDWNLIGVG